MTVVTALTVQGRKGLQNVMKVPVSFVEEQMRAVLDGFEVDVVKIGMLYDGKLIEMVGRLLEEYRLSLMVLDPVMQASMGRQALLEEGADRVLREVLLPKVDVITPNVYEAGRLTGRLVRTVENMERAAQEIIKMGPKNVVVTGGDLDTKDVTNVLCHYGSDGKSRIKRFMGERVQTNAWLSHGTGCSFSSALACYLLRGVDMEQAVGDAGLFVRRTLMSASKPSKA